MVVTYTPENNAVTTVNHRYKGYIKLPHTFLILKMSILGNIKQFTEQQIGKITIKLHTCKHIRMIKLNQVSLNKMLAA